MVLDLRPKQGGQNVTEAAQAVLSGSLQAAVALGDLLGVQLAVALAASLLDQPTADQYDGGSAEAAERTQLRSDLIDALGSSSDDFAVGMSSELAAHASLIEQVHARTVDPSGRASRRLCFPPRSVPTLPCDQPRNTSPTPWPPPCDLASRGSVTDRSNHTRR